VCASCGKARSVSNWSYTVAGRERSTGTKVRARAEQIAARAKTDFNEQGVRALVIPKVIPTLAAFAPTFLAYVEAAQTLRPKTKLSYQNGWRLLSKTKLAGMRLTAIGTADADVVTFPGSGSNANQALRTLSRMLSHACSVDILKARPVINLRDERKRNTTIDLWLEDLLLESAPPALRGAIVLGLDAGMRPDESCAVRWEHVRWAEGAILIPDGKTTNAERWVPLTVRAAMELRAAKARNAATAKRRKTEESEWVFPSSRTSSGHVQPDYHQSWARTLDRVREAAGKRNLKLPDGLVLYSCRHTFATNYLKASGNDQAALKAIMGHSSMRITERYVHPGVSDAAATMDKFNTDRRGLRLVKEA
jgi:site-specific recombinase XerD